MTTRKLEKARWRAFFDVFSNLLIGKQAEVEVASLDLGDQVEAEWLPLHGIAYDSEGPRRGGVRRLRSYDTQDRVKSMSKMVQMD
jgi:hypothetical protein